MHHRRPSRIAEILRITLLRVEQREDLDQSASSTISLKRILRRKIAEADESASIAQPLSSSTSKFQLSSFLKSQPSTWQSVWQSIKSRMHEINFRNRKPVSKRPTLYPASSVSEKVGE